MYLYPPYLSRIDKFWKLSGDDCYTLCMNLGPTRASLAKFMYSLYFYVFFTMYFWHEHIIFLLATIALKLRYQWLFADIVPESSCQKTTASRLKNVCSSSCNEHIAGTFSNSINSFKIYPTHSVKFAGSLQTNSNAVPGQKVATDGRETQS